MSIKKLSSLLIGGVILMVLAYGIALVAIVWPIDELSINKSGVFGDSFGLLTSLFSGLAFAGLIITIVMQKDELALQREELKLQRAALEGQVAELKSMSKYAAIDQVRSMIDADLLRLSESGGEVTKPEHFFAAMMPGPEWKTLIESKNPEEVMQAFQVYTKKIGPADIFVSGFSSAAKFYLYSIGNEHVDFTLNEFEFIAMNNSWLKDVPYLSTYLTSVVQYVEQKLTYEPAHKMFLLAFLVATQKMMGSTDIVKKDSIKKIVEYLNKHGKELPAIAKT
jgi:hypothetical protein